MKIIFLTSSLDAGGAERVATTLCNAWAARGETVTLIPTFSGGGQPFYKVADAVEVIYLADLVGCKRKSLWSYTQRLSALRKLIVERQPDVIVSFLPNVNVAAVLASAFLKIPLIISERRDPSSQPCSKFWEIACRLSYRHAEMLTVQTESVTESVARIYSRLRLVRSVPNPLPNGVVSIERKGRSRQRRVLLSLGRLSAEKQIDIGLSAFACMAPHFENWDFHIYGEGPLRPTLDKQIKTLGMQGRAFLMGRTTEPWQVMANTDAFILTSQCEGFPNALLEAMGVGLPCVVFDCPSGPRAITRDGNDAILVTLNDQNTLGKALEKIMSNDAFSAKLGAQARSSILERYRLSSVLDSWDQLFREIGVSI